MWHSLYRSITNQCSPWPSSMINSIEIDTRAVVEPPSGSAFLCTMRSGFVIVLKWEWINNNHENKLGVTFICYCIALTRSMVENLAPTRTWLGGKLVFSFPNWSVISVKSMSNPSLLNVQNPLFSLNPAVANHSTLVKINEAGSSSNFFPIFLIWYCSL